MYNASSRTYCCTCGKEKRSFKSCISNHHSIVIYNPAYEYDFGNKEELFEDRYISVVKTPIITSDVTNVTSLCPIHEKTAMGYCFDCNRCICMTDNYHFDHKMILFKDYGIDNNIDYDDNARFEYEDNVAQLRALEAVDKDMIRAASLNLKDVVIRTIATWITTYPTRFQPFLIEAINVINAFKESDANNDLNEVDKDIANLKTALEAMSRSNKLQQLIYEMMHPRELPGKYKRKLRDMHRGIYGEVVIVTADTYIMKRKAPFYEPIGWNDVRRIDQDHYLTFSFDQYYPYRLFDSTKPTFKGGIRIGKHVKYVGFKSTNIVSSFSCNFNNDLYFLNDSNELVHIDIDKKKETVLDRKFKRILTLYNTSIRVMGVNDKNEIWYLTDDWHLFPMKIPYDKLSYYIGSKYSTDVIHGILASNDMLYRVCKPSIRIRCIFLYYDNGIVLCSGRSFKALDLVF